METQHKEKTLKNKTSQKINHRSFVRGILRSPLTLHKRPVIRKAFSYQDAIIIYETPAMRHVVVRRSLHDVFLYHVIMHARYWEPFQLISSGQNGNHIFKRVFLMENVRISITF